MFHLVTLHNTYYNSKILHHAAVHVHEGLRQWHHLNVDSVPMHTAHAPGHTDSGDDESHRMKYSKTNTIGHIFFPCEPYICDASYAFCTERRDGLRDASRCVAHRIIQLSQDMSRLFTLRFIKIVTAYLSMLYYRSTLTVCLVPPEQWVTGRFPCPSLLRAWMSFLNKCHWLRRSFEHVG